MFKIVIKSSLISVCCVIYFRCNIESLGPTRLTISSGTNTGMIIPGSEILSLASEGFLIDVDAFSSDGHDYIVLAFGYSDKKCTVVN